MVKIVVTQDLGLSESNINDLKELGELKIYNQLSKTPEEWFKRCENSDIICTGKFGLKTDKTYELKNKFFALPFVGIGFLNKVKLQESNITVSYCPGCNKDAVSEWILAMTLNLTREFPKFINNITLPDSVIPKNTFGLTNKKITILGKGNIGSRVGKIFELLDARVNYFTRKENLIQSVQDSDIIINTLSKNPTTENLLDKRFFSSLKRKSYFVSVTGSSIFNVESLIHALDDNILASAAIDAGGIQVCNIDDKYYQRLVKHPKILATPHIAYNSDITDEVANKMMINNIKAWLKKKPVNILR